MSRPLRIDYPGAWYHVMNRGRWSETIIFSDADRREFIRVLRSGVRLDKWVFTVLRMNGPKKSPSLNGDEPVKNFV
ncbi:MAG: hypothetical protein KKB30_11685 [Proteobacteria bacterium]|nr:hypothetical protein [Pseudomonadota bacterium]MBU1717090.1 hypothetical protein [Pseudomonadota bacterium]